MDDFKIRIVRSSFTRQELQQIIDLRFGIPHNYDYLQMSFGSMGKITIPGLVLSKKSPKGSSTTLTMYANTAAESAPVYLISRIRNFARFAGTAEL